MWHPEATHVTPLNYGGVVMPELKRQVVHTVEGTRYTPSRASYYGHQLWPSATIAPDGSGVWRIWQHLPLNRAAAAMRNQPGGVETNRDGCVQVEVAWFAADAANLPDGACERLHAWLWWVHVQSGIPWRWPQFHRYPPVSPDRLGSEPWRMAGGEWQAWRGICGHQHAPENVHGDPGAIPVDRIFERGEAMSLTDEQARQLAEVRTILGGIGAGGWRWTGGDGRQHGDLSWLDAKLAPLAERLARVELLLDGGPPVYPADVEALADAVADRLAARLAE